MIDNVHQANRILLSFIVRERAHRAHVFRKDPAKLAEKLAQCDGALQRLEHMIQGGPVSIDKSYRFIKALIKGEEFWRGKIFQGQQREDKLADCAKAYAALLFLHETLAPVEPEQLSLLG
jgi:hypothetical protein